MCLNFANCSDKSKSGMGGTLNYNDDNILCFSGCQVFAISYYTKYIFFLKYFDNVVGQEYKSQPL